MQFISTSSVRLKAMVWLFFLALFLLVPPLVDAAPSGATITKAKENAESKGYTFYSSHGEIVAKAKAEGKLRALTGLEGVVGGGLGPRPEGGRLFEQDGQGVRVSQSRAITR